MLKQIVGPVLKSLFRISIILEVINSSSRGVWGWGWGQSLSVLIFDAVSCFQFNLLESDN